MHRNLNLLIRHRTRIAQEIAATREQIAAVRQQIRDLKSIRADLAAIDRTLGLHDIQVDPDDIIPVHNKYKRLNLPHGEMSLCIYAAIRASGGPTTRSSIFTYLAAKPLNGLTPLDALARGKLAAVRTAARGFVER